MHPTYTHEQLVSIAKFTDNDLEEIRQCRRDYNRLGFGYQVACVRLFNRLPTGHPLEVIDDILTYASTQLNIPGEDIAQYAKWQKTVFQHQERIKSYLDLRTFGSALTEIEAFLLKEAYQLEQTAALTAHLRKFLTTHRILEPSQDTMTRLIQKQREAARTSIYSKVSEVLSEETRQRLDALISTEDATYSPLHYLKQPPGNPAPASFTKLTDTLEKIKETDILSIDLTWLNNNFQRSLARYARQCSLHRLRRLKEERRYAVLTCFLRQLHQDTFDAAVRMHDKLMNKMYNKADKEVDAHMKERRKHIRSALAHYRKILGVLLDEGIKEQDIGAAIFRDIDEEILKAEMQELEDILSNQYSDSFKRVIARHSYLRQFAPALLEHITFQPETNDRASEELMEAVGLLNSMNAENKHKLPEDVPTGFIPKKLRAFIFQDGKPYKAAWECALITVVRDQIKSGNLCVPNSKRYASLDTFFVPDTEWASNREAFFARAGLPVNPDDVPAYLTNRLNQAYDRFLESLPDNQYVQLDDEGWRVTTDPTEKLDYGTDSNLNPLKEWLGKHIRTIKLPELLIEVDNELQFSRYFMSAAEQECPDAQHVCEVLATVMAHASEVGPYTMSQITAGISYNRMKHITDWYIYEEAQRSALARIVNAISSLDITKYWGDGTTSSSDGQRFSLQRKVLHKDYSHAFNDFALEFYNHVADTYAPYHGNPHECTDRDAPYVLDGLLYNESDLNIEEHYTDTHGFTDTNFAAFAMFGKRFIPRIKGLYKHAIFYIDPHKDHGPLSVLLEKKDRLLHASWVAQQWDRMGHFYYSLECGHATASTALRRLNGFTGKNHFYRANREFGCLIRTEYTLNFMSDPDMRRRNRRGLLKGEEIHSLARDLKYGHRGKLNSRDWLQQKHSCSCLTLVIACIVYWQAKEIHRVIQTHTLPDDIDLSLLSHISPVSWENIILYGDYILDRNKVAALQKSLDRIFA